MGHEVVDASRPRFGASLQGIIGRERHAIDVVVPFRGVVLGVSRRKVVACLRVEGLAARAETFSGFQAILRGFAGAKFLNREELPHVPDRRAQRGLVVLLAVWAATSVAVFAMVASFVLGALPSLRFPLLIAAVILVVSALSLTFYVGGRLKGMTGEFGEGIGDILAASLLMDPFFGLLAGLLALAILLFLFLLLVLWLPLLVLILNVVSFGELLRSYRGAVITAEDSRLLRGLGRSLLREGGVLSRSWDLYLDSADRVLSADRRSIHLRMHYALLALGVFSLALAVEEVISRAIPSPGWEYLLVGTAAVSAFCAVLFFGALVRRGSFRRRGMPPGVALPP